MLIVYFFFLFIFLKSEAYFENDCLSRNYNNAGTVCVCNSVYCDTIPRPEKVERPKCLIYTSNKQGLRFNKRKGTFTNKSCNFANEIFVDTTRKLQKIEGWGGAFTDAAGINIASLSEAAQENLLKSYFSADGIEYSLCRVPIGGTDFSTHSYSYHDESLDPELKNFKLADEDFQYKIPFIKKAQNLTSGNVRLFASAWTAPKWMKTNNDYKGLGFLKDTMYQAWADYTLKFLDNYLQQGIHFWGVTTGNEPSLALIPYLNNINSVAWFPWQAKKWLLNNLGPTLRNSSHANIKIMILDDQRFFLPFYANMALDDEAVRSYVDGIAVHWYYDKMFPPILLTTTHKNFPDKFILATQACRGFAFGKKHVLLGSWERGESYAENIIEDMLHWVVGWVDWNMALDLTGGPTYINNHVDSPIIVNASSGEFYKQPMFYCLGHFSKFVPKDSVRVYSTGFDSTVPVVAFQRPDNGTVVVILNKRADAVQVKLSDKLRGNIYLLISAKSITTILYW